MKPREQVRRMSQVVEARRLLRQIREQAAAQAQVSLLDLQADRRRQLDQLAADQHRWLQSVEGDAIGLHVAPAWRHQFETTAAALQRNDEDLQGARDAFDKTSVDLAEASGALDVAKKLARDGQTRLRRQVEERQMSAIADHGALRGVAR